MKGKRNQLCPSYLYSLSVANKHTKKEFSKIDAENQKLDQMEFVFNEK